MLRHARETMLCGQPRLALFASFQQETTMGTRTVSRLLAICAAGVWAPAHAQNADTSVVKLPQDIVYKGLSGAPINQPQLAQCGLKCRRQLSSIFRSELRPVFGFEDRPNRHVQPQAARRRRRVA